MKGSIGTTNEYSEHRLLHKGTEPMVLTIVPAEGGYVVRFDRAINDYDISNGPVCKPKLYVLQSTDDIATAISQIITAELLRR